MLAYAAVLALALTQEDPAVERQVQRLRDQLRLTEDQLPKVREIVKKQMDELKAVLTDEQKPRLEGGRDGERGGGPPPWAGRGRRGGLPDTDDLKTQLGLTEAQISRINELRDQAREEMRRFFQNRSPRDGGEDLGQALEKMRNDTYAKIREALNDDQKPKFDEILKQAQAATQTAEATRGRGGSIDDRIARTMEALKFEKPEEAEAVKGLVRKVYEAMEKVETAQRDARRKIEELARSTELSEEAVGDQLAAARQPLKALEKDLAAARAELADVVSARQEAELLRRGVLR